MFRPCSHPDFISQQAILSVQFRRPGWKRQPWALMNTSPLLLVFTKHCGVIAWRKHPTDWHKAPNPWFHPLNRHGLTHFQTDSTLINTPTHTHVCTQIETHTLTLSPHKNACTHTLVHTQANKKNTCMPSPHRHTHTCLSLTKEFSFQALQRFWWPSANASK